MSKWSSAYRDSRWQKKRLRIMERDKFSCRSCGTEEEGITLNVHHIYYEKGKAPWEYDDELLVTWCDDCHKARHKMQKEILVDLARMSMPTLQDIPHILKMRWGTLTALGSVVTGTNEETLFQLFNSLVGIQNDSFAGGMDFGTSSPSPRRETGSEVAN